MNLTETLVHGREALHTKSDTFKDWVFNISASLVGGFMVYEGVKLVGWLYEKKVQSDEISKDFPEPNNNYIDGLFHAPKTTFFKSPRNEVINKETNEIFRSILEKAKDHDGIYIAYGSSGIGKTTSLHHVLNSTNIDHFYYSLQDDIAEITSLIVPETIHKGFDFPFIKCLSKALLSYGTYRTEKGIHDNAILILDNCEKLAASDLAKLKNLAKTLMDQKCPIMMLLVSNDKDPTTLIDKMSKMSVHRISDPSAGVADDYLKKIHVNADYIRDVSKITGTTFKYMNEVAAIRKGLIRERFLTEVKQVVHEKIGFEIGNYIDQECFPEVIEVCQLLLDNESIPMSHYWRITGNLEKDEVLRENYWSSQLLKKGLFMMDRGNVYFDNFATKEYVREKLKTVKANKK